MKSNRRIRDLYDELYRLHGPQGWWPVSRTQKTEHSERQTAHSTRNTALSTQHTGHSAQHTKHSAYHPDDFSFPKDDLQRFEIICGCILTQNTSWKMVEKALENLIQKDLLQPEKISNCDIDLIKEAIRPAGYFNQKAERLKIIADWFLDKIKTNKTPSREELLKIKGVGPETADSILLYAYKVPEFIVDTYTKRILLKEKLITEKDRYDDIKELFEHNLEKDYKVFQEYHALIVEEGKNLKKRKAD